ncbi:MAG: cysteine--tRNA ligase [Planctomycetota bacterium]
MAIVYYNSYSHREEPFETLEPGVVRFYSCGPTVHDYAHIGNFRCFVFVDLIRRHLELRGYEVRHVMNITDVGHMTTDADEGEDKIGKSARERGMDPWEVVNTFSQAFFEDIDALRLERAMAYPRATEHVDDMIRLVERILDAGFAYEANGSVYFDVSSFTAYGRLSGNTVSDLMHGHRVDVNPDKRSPVDFALWKAAPNSFMRWESPWSVGVPGWHVECTAMAMRYLGDQIDIHTGGEDNIFPHHECEIAQAEAATGKSPYCRFWMHNRHLLVESTKMSKSKGNFYTLRDLVEQGHSPVAIRYLLLSSHYRQPLNFTMEGLEAAATAVHRINDFVARLDEAPEADGGPDVAERCETAKEHFAAALDDDLNVSQALAAVFDFMHEINRLQLTAVSAEPVREAMQYFDRVLDVLDKPEDQVLDEEVERLIEERQAARKARDFERADAIRDQLDAQGIILEDTPQGVRWRRI